MSAKLDALIEFEWGPQPKKRARECTTIKLFSCGEHIGDLDAYDTHGNGRSNKSWLGTVCGIEIDLPNLREVATFAKAKGWTFQKL